MRLSEKTIELTFCHQFGNFLERDVVWFGLTQKQEARAGFDACTKLGGRLLILQFKASNKTLKNSGARQFKAQHDQMVHLKRICKGRRGVYYTFPLVGNTKEIADNPCILDSTWFLDVSYLPNSIPQPTKKDGGLRKSKIHYIDVLPGKAAIHSESFEVKLKSSDQILIELEEDRDLKEFGLDIKDLQAIENIQKYFKRNSIGGIILP